MLNVISVEEALKLIDEHFTGTPPKTESVRIEEALGRVTAEDIYSVEDVPSFSRSVMDGYALCSADTFGAGETMPSILRLTGEILMGQETTEPIGCGECRKIPTGGMLPPGADAVIPVEYTAEEDGDCLCFKSVCPKENVTEKGDDVKKGELLIKRSTPLSFTHIGVLACAGIGYINVRKQLTVGILSTGDELTDIDSPARPGTVRDVNSHLLSAMLTKYGCRTAVYPRVKDDENELSLALEKAVSECDIVLLSGGSSAGEKDASAKVIGGLGTVYAHGVAMKPGKPTVIGQVNGKPVFGLPGHPAACCFVTRILLKPLIQSLTGEITDDILGVCSLTENVPSNHGREEFICVKVKDDMAVPLYAKSGIISLLSRCDGFIRIERDAEGLEKGYPVTVYKF